MAVLVLVVGETRHHFVPFKISIHRTLRIKQHDSRQKELGHGKNVCRVIWCGGTRIAPENNWFTVPPLLTFYQKRGPCVLHVHICQPAVGCIGQYQLFC